MKQQKSFARKVAGLAVSAAALVLLAACSVPPLSKVDDHGKTDKPVFPELNKATMDWREGVVVDRSVVALLQPDLTRDQLYQILGRPHFSEGFRVREWDYVLYFGPRGKTEPCQLKVLFDKNLRAQSYHWLPAGCQGAAPVAAAPKSFNLMADALFAFDSSTLRPGAEAELDKLVEKINQHAADSTVTITGYTDRLGSAAYNQRLSQARAQAVRGYLVGKGIASSRIHATGRGAANPVSSCSRGLSKTELINCLQPDRRVEVTIGGAKK